MDELHLAEFNACVRGFNEAHGGGPAASLSDADHDALIEKYG